MNLVQLLEDFNPSKFVVHSCLLIFTALFALRLDNTLNWSYWYVFIPLWFWKILVILGAGIGSCVWWRYPHSRLEGEAYIHYKSMLISLVLHLILLLFELLVCDKLESGRHLWILVFNPLLFVSIISIAVCIWAVRHDRSFELELFCAVNVLQFLFLALRLDGFILWSWEVVLVPLWIVMCLSLVGVVYVIVFAAMLVRTPEINAYQRKSSFRTAIGYTFLYIPILVFQVLITNKLDDNLKITYIACTCPLFVSFLTLIIMSFSAKGGNQWWFGIRTDFCSFILNACPLLQEYGNIANTAEERSNEIELQRHTDKPEYKVKRADLLKPVVPIVSIETPD